MGVLKWSVFHVLTPDRGGIGRAVKRTFPQILIRCGKPRVPRLSRQKWVVLFDLKVDVRSAFDPDPVLTTWCAQPASATLANTEGHR